MGPRGRLRLRSAPNTCSLLASATVGVCAVLFFSPTKHNSVCGLSSYLFKSVTPNRTLKRERRRKTRDERRDDERWVLPSSLCPRNPPSHPFPVPVLATVGVMPNLLPRGLFLGSERLPTPIFLLTLIRGKFCVYFQVTREKSFA